MNAKRILAIFLSVIAIVLCLTLAACNENKENPTKAPTTASTETPTTLSTEEPTSNPTEAPTAEPTEAPTAAPTEAPTSAPTEAPTEAHVHKYSDGEIQTEATCTTKGVILYSCMAEGCFHSYTEEYSLPTLTAGEVYNNALSYVGEITTYDQYGEEYALGTGFVISADGQILTNHHVIEGAYSASITIGEEEYEITGVLAFDELIDLAILKIDATNLPVATLCAKDMSVGDSVYAIGSSQGMTNTFSQGIITYWNRDVDGVIHVQHDASISSGNSGGPLLNAYGEVIGVNTWTLEDSQNLNFAVSVCEIENLTYIDEMPLDEFVETYYSAFDAIYDWIEYNYTTNEETYFCYDETYDDGSWYSLGYDFDYGVIYIDVLWEFEDGYSLYVCIEFDEISSEHFYYFEYYDSEYNLISAVEGYINATTFTADTALTYDYSEGEVDADTLAAYQEYVVDLISWFGLMLDNNGVGVTLDDVGFVAFEYPTEEGSSPSNPDTPGASNPALDTLYTWIENNSTTNEEEYICYDEYYDDGSWYSLGYDITYDVIYIDVLWEFEDGYMLYACVELAASEEFLYYSQYYEAEGTTYSYVEGYIDAATFTADTVLTHDYSEGDITLDSDMDELYTLCVVDLVAWFDAMLTENTIGVTAVDIGFTALAA